MLSWDFFLIPSQKIESKEVCYFFFFLSAELSVKVSIFSQFDALPYDTYCAEAALGTPPKGSENEQPEGQILV